MFLIDPELVKLCAVDHHLLMEKELPILFNDVVMEMGLFHTTGDVWKRQRNTLAAAFHFDKIMSRTDAIKETSKELVERIKQKQDFSKPCQVLDFYQRCTGNQWIFYSSGDVMVKTFFGKHFITKTFNGEQITSGVSHLFNQLFSQSFRPLLSILRLIFFGEPYIRHWPMFMFTKYEK